MAPPKKKKPAKPPRVPRAGAGRTQAPPARAKSRPKRKKATPPAPPRPRKKPPAKAGGAAPRSRKRKETVEETIRRIRGIPPKGKAPAKRKAPVKKATPKRKPPKKGPPKRPPRKPPVIRKRGPEGVRDQIRRMLRNWETKLRQAFPGKPKFVTDVRVFMSRDFHISGELAIDAILKSVSIDRLLLELGIAMHGSAVNGAWLSIGFTFPPSVKVEDFELYRKLKGSLAFQTHSRRFTKQLVPYIVQEARRLHEKFRTRRRYRARIVFVKIWWNPDGKRPGGRLKKRRGKKR